MKVFAYFIEPASYTLDLINNIHDKLGIDFLFINNTSQVKSDDSLPNDKFLSNRSWISKIRFLKKKRRENDLIIVNGYNNYPFILTFLFNFFSFNRKYIATESDTKLRIPSNYIKRIIKSFYLNIIFRNRYVLGYAGGSETHKELFLYYGMNEKRIFIIPMMINNQKYYINEKIQPELFTFLFVGRFLSTKNVNILCEVFESSFSDKNAKLVLVGDGGCFDDCKSIFLSDKIEFKGSVFGKELIEIYQNSSVFVFPSTLEQWGLVVNEALASSLPVIAHKEVGSVFDLIKGKETGFVIESWTELEDKMLELYNNSDLCKQFSENAARLMKEKWNYKMYKNNLLESFKFIGI